MVHSGNEEDQGQITIGAAHNDSAVREIFAPFEIVKHFPYSDLAGEQDLYVFRKPGKTPKIIHESFTLNNQARFRVYPRVLSQSISLLDCRVEIKPLIDVRVRLNNQRVFGPSHYFVVDVPVPKYEGAVSINLSCISRLDGSPPDLEVEWNYPHFY
jgi:hypothetical protein